MREALVCEKSIMVFSWSCQGILATNLGGNWEKWTRVLQHRPMAAPGLHCLRTKAYVNSLPLSTISLLIPIGQGTCDTGQAWRPWQNPAYLDTRSEERRVGKECRSRW